MRAKAAAAAAKVQSKVQSAKAAAAAAKAKATRKEVVEEDTSSGSEYETTDGEDAGWPLIVPALRRPSNWPSPLLLLLDP
jgi:hypothetical protein